MRFVLVLAALFWTQIAVAEGNTGLITVTGEGSVDAEPDMAWITIGVSEDAPTAAEATDKATTAMSDVIARFAAIGIDEADMQTSGINLHPRYDNRPRNDGEPPKLIGYVFSTTLQVRIRSLEMLGQVMDDAVGEGANGFHGLRFDIAEPRPLQDEARVRAVQDAVAKATLLAQAAGVSLGSIHSISEHGGRRGGPVMMAEAAMMRDSGGGVAAGEVTLQSSVTMVFEIAD